MRKWLTVLTVALLAAVGCGGGGETAVTDAVTTTVTTTVTLTTLAAPTTTIAPTTTTTAVVYQSDEQRLAVERVERQIDLFFSITEQQVTSFFETTNFALSTKWENGKWQYQPSAIFAFGPYFVPMQPDADVLALSLGTFPVVAANGDELIIMPIGLMNSHAGDKVIFYTLADIPVGSPDPGLIPPVILIDGQRNTAVVNGSEVETLTFLAGNVGDDTRRVDLGAVSDLAADYFSPPGALPIVRLAYKKEYTWEFPWMKVFLSDDPTKIERLNRAISDAITKGVFNDPGIYCLRTDTHVPVNEINLIANFSDGIEHLMFIDFLFVMTATFLV